MRTQFDAFSAFFHLTKFERKGDYNLKEKESVEWFMCAQQCLQCAVWRTGHYHFFCRF